MKGKLVLWTLQQFLQSLLYFASAGLRKRILGGDRFYLHPIFSTARGIPLPLSSARGVVHVLPSQPRATELPEPHLGSGSPSPPPPEPELLRAAPLSSGEGRRRATSSHAAPPPSLPPSATPLARPPSRPLSPAELEVGRSASPRADGGADPVFSSFSGQGRRRSGAPTASSFFPASISSRRPPLLHWCYSALLAPARAPARQASSRADAEDDGALTTVRRRPAGRRTTAAGSSELGRRPPPSARCGAPGQQLLHGSSAPPARVVGPAARPSPASRSLPVVSSTVRSIRVPAGDNCPGGCICFCATLLDFLLVCAT
jgi:hypothetical protein